ncbi:MAG: nickel-dependent hydrogenase large subunit [Pseudomonadota bacterium]
MGIEGSLIIQLQLESGLVKQATIRSSRPVHASKVFHAKSVDQALKILPVLFSICGSAQACAGVRACEQALGIEAPADIEIIRDSLVHMETLREHLWRILLDWPILINQLPQKNGMVALLKQHKEYQQLISAGINPFYLQQELPVYDTAKLAGIVNRIKATFQQLVYGISIKLWLEIDSLEKLQLWAESNTTIAAQLLAWVIQQQWSETGRCEISSLPVLVTNNLHKLLQNNNFVEQPQWLAECCETTSLSRIDSPLLQQLNNQFGNGLLVRLVARLTEMALLTKALLMDGKQAFNKPVQLFHNSQVFQQGFGDVCAARGHLIHYVCIENKQIKKYQIVAPTEWNFHPQGVVSRSLTTLKGSRKQIEQQARLIINAIDPCVGYELSLTELSLT